MTLATYRVTCVFVFTISLILAVEIQAQTVNSAEFGPATTFYRNAGESYTGITLTATPANFGTGGFDGYTDDIILPDANSDYAIFPPPPEGPSVDGFGSTITILAGIASADTNVSLQFRRPNRNEVFGFSESPPLDNSPGYNSVLSDIVRITGIAATGPAAPDNRIPTDTFVIQMSYRGGSYLEDYIFEYGGTRDWTEADIVAQAEIQIAFFNESTGYFADDDLGNFGNGPLAIQNYPGPYSTFAADHNILESDLDDYLGSWGVDMTNRQVWAVVNHTTDFTVTPEPNALALMLTLGSLIITSCRSRRL